jgi:hypothetical protein
MHIDLLRFSGKDFFAPVRDLEMAPLWIVKKTRLLHIRSGPANAVVKGPLFPAGKKLTPLLFSQFELVGESCHSISHGMNLAVAGEMQEREHHCLVIRNSHE